MTKEAKEARLGAIKMIAILVLMLHNMIYWIISGKQSHMESQFIYQFNLFLKYI